MKLIISILLCVCLLATFTIVIQNIEHVFKATDYAALGTRISNYLDLNSLNEVSQDSSFQARISTQQQYIEGIMKRPFLGRGINGSSYDKSVGLIFLSSHNVFLEQAYNYGILYVLFLLFVLFNIYRLFNRKVIEYSFSSNIILQIIVAIISISFFTNTTFDSRTLISLLGGINTLLIFPNKIYLNLDSNQIPNTIVNKNRL